MRSFTDSDVLNVAHTRPCRSSRSEQAPGSARASANQTVATTSRAPAIDCNCTRAWIGIVLPRGSTRKNSMDTPRQPATYLRKFAASCAGRRARQRRSAVRSRSCYRVTAWELRRSASTSRTCSAATPNAFSISAFGDGEALVTNALNNPTVDYLGIEVHEPGIGHLLLLLEQAAVTNVLRPRARCRGRRADLRRTRASTPSIFSSGSVAEEAASRAASCNRHFVAEIARVLKTAACAVRLDGPTTPGTQRAVLTDNERFASSSRASSAARRWRFGRRLSSSVAACVWPRGRHLSIVEARRLGASRRL